jgi:very-short-patch-repair endonuclease
LQTRVFSPFGVPYAIDIDALQASGKDDVQEAMEAIVSRDEELLEQGYRVLHLGSEDVLSAPRDIIELVKRLV